MKQMRFDQCPNRPRIYKEVRSYRFAGERDAGCVVKNDVLRYSSRNFPRKIFDPMSNNTVDVYFDIVEYPSHDDLHWARITQANENIAYSTPTTEFLQSQRAPALPFNATAWFDGNSYWIIINGRVLTALGWFSGSVFGDPSFRSALRMGSLTDEQVMLVESATIRMALEIAMYHEYGHIACGHARSVSRNVNGMLDAATFSDRNALGQDEKQVAIHWRRALELAADDFAATNLAMRSHFRQFWTFPFEQELLMAGVQAPTICMMLGFITYFYLDSIFNLEEAPHYPKLDERLRYFYMALSDTKDRLEREQEGHEGRIDLSLYSAALLVRSAFAAYSSSEAREDVGRVLDGLAWIDDDSQEAEVMERVKENYSYFSAVEPYYTRLKYESNYGRI